jgi:hypothetical protein
MPRSIKHRSLRFDKYFLACFALVALSPFAGSSIVDQLPLPNSLIIFTFFIRAKLTNIRYLLLFHLNRLPFLLGGVSLMVLPTVKR